MDATSYREDITKEDFNEFIKNLDYSALPEGIKFELNRVSKK